MGILVVFFGFCTNIGGAFVKALRVRSVRGKGKKGLTGSLLNSTSNLSTFFPCRTHTGYMPLKLIQFE